MIKSKRSKKDSDDETVKRKETNYQSFEKRSNLSDSGKSSKKSSKKSRKDSSSSSSSDSDSDSDSKSSKSLSKKSSKDFKSFV